MSNLFDGLKFYESKKWSVKDERAFDDEERAMVARATVVDSDYGLSCCFTMKSGASAYIPMARDAHVAVGQILDLTKARVLTLERNGERDINRIDY